MQANVGTSNPEKYANKFRMVLTQEVNIGPIIKQPLLNNRTKINI